LEQTLVPFGLLDGRMVAVDEVPSGLACGCRCPACTAPLVAKKGEQRAHHFSHLPGNPPCRHGYETALHLMAKQVLAECSHLALPALDIVESNYDAQGTIHSEEGRVCDASSIDLDAVAVEREIQGIRPDAIGWVRGIPILIEIVVRNAISPAKRAQVRAANLACLEIDLSKESPLAFTAERLKQIVIDGVECKRWVFHPREPAILERVRARLRNRIAEANAAEAEARRLRAQRRNVTLRAETDGRSAKPRTIPAGGRLTHRWLRCDTCHEIYNIGPYESAATITSYDCGACGQPIQLQPPSTRRR
jgi:hypothetical protein